MYVQGKFSIVLTSFYTILLKFFGPCTICFIDLLTFERPQCWFVPHGLHDSYNWVIYIHCIVWEKKGNAKIKQEDIETFIKTEMIAQIKGFKIVETRGV